MMIKTFSIRIDADLLNKIHFIAAYDGRSGNGEVIYFLQKAVAEFESQHGPVPLAPVAYKPL